jgi:cytochrome c oxidase assembly protein subunit 15
VHRFLAWLVLALTLGLGAYLYRGSALRWLAHAGAVVAVLAVIQFNLGAFTVVYRVPIGLAVVHQGMAYLLLSAAVVLWHRARGRGSPDGGRQAARGDGGLARPG